DRQIHNIVISRGISDGRGLEEGMHLGGTALQAAHVGGQTGLERRLVPRRAAARHRLLEVIIEEFVRIVLGRVEKLWGERRGSRTLVAGTKPRWGPTPQSTEPSP